METMCVKIDQGYVKNQEGLSNRRIEHTKTTMTIMDKKVASKGTSCKVIYTTCLMVEGEKEENNDVKEC